MQASDRLAPPGRGRRAGVAATTLFLGCQDKYYGAEDFVCLEFAADVVRGPAGGPAVGDAADGGRGQLVEPGPLGVGVEEGQGPERPGVVDPRRLETSAEAGRVSGVKATVPDGEAADFCVVAVRAAGNAPSLYLVDLASPGVLREPVSTFDPSRAHARIRFEKVAAEPLPGAVGPDAARTLIDRAAAMMAFEQVGNAEAALEMARDYSLTRYAFGRPIGSFQAIKHKLADVYIAVELARSNAYYGAWALSTDAAELPIAAAVARIAACEAGWLATKENIQTHGGMGFTWQFDCHLYYRRARLLGSALGSAREWKHRLVDALKTRNMAELASE